jgi:uncharacterized delta-60 repeat protein
VANGSLPLTYQWRKDGINLQNNARISGVQTATLALSNAFGADAGAYSVVVSNVYGSSTSSVATLTVIDPVINAQPTNQFANGGQAITFIVGAAGSGVAAPVPSYQWRKEGVNLAGATASSLTLTGVQGADTGNYDVIVTGFNGSITSAVAVLEANLALPDFTANVNGNVSAVAIQPDGRILVGGTFSVIQGQLRTNLARINKDGTLDSFYNPNVYNPNAGDTVLALCIQKDARSLAAGRFYRVGNLPRNGLARLNLDGTPDPNSDLDAPGGVYCFAGEPEGSILLGGQFYHIGSNPTTFEGLGRLTDQGVDPAFSTVYVNGVVFSMALQADRNVLLAGYILGIGQSSATNLVRISSNLVMDTNFLPASDFYVYSAVVQPDAKILLGGTFTTINGQTQSYICRLTANGTLDNEFHPVVLGVGPSAFVSSIALQTDGKIIVGGTFTNLCGHARSAIGRLNSDGTLDPIFNPRADGYSPTVSSVALQDDGKVLIGGQFQRLAGLSCTDIGRVNNTEPATQSLARNGSTVTWLRGGTSPEIYAAAFDYSNDGSNWVSIGNGARVSGGWQITGASIPAGATLRARGFLTGGAHNSSSWYVESTSGNPVLTSQPLSRTNIAGTLASFSVAAAGPPPLTYQWFKDGVPLQDSGTIFGSLTPSLSISNVLHANGGDYFVAVTASSGSVTSSIAQLTVIDPVILQPPLSQSVSPGQSATFTVVAAGTSLKYQWRKNAIAIAGATGTSLAMANLQSGNAGNYDVLVTNSFGSLTSAPAMLSVNTVFVDSFNPFASGRVDSLAVQTDGSVIIAGEFGSLAGSTRSGFGRVTSAGGLDSFAPNIGGSGVMEVAIQPDYKILIGGYFFTINGQTHNRLARFNPDGSVDMSFNPNISPSDWVDCVVPLLDGKTLVGSAGLNLARLNDSGAPDASFLQMAPGEVEAVAVQPDAKILIGGYFPYLRRLHPNGALDNTIYFPIGGDNVSIMTIALQADGKILLGGRFITLSAPTRTNLVRLNADGSLDNSFKADATIYVTSLAVQTDGKIIVGGNFSSLAGQSRTNIGRLNSDGTLDPTFDPGASDTVNSVTLQPDGKILVGGAFSKLAGTTRSGVGRLINTDPASQTLTYDGSDIVWLRSGTAPEIWTSTFAVSTNGTNWADVGTGVRIPGGWRLADVPVATNTTIRARGFVVGSQWFVEQTVAVNPNTRPRIVTSDANFGVRSGKFGFSTRAFPGQVVVIEATTNFIQWVPLQTNLVANVGKFVFTDSQFGNFPRRFYRARLFTGALPLPSIRTDGSLGYRSGALEFALATIEGQTIIIEASTNLVNWLPISTNNSPTVFRDTSSAQFSRRFYRLRLP